MPRHRRPLRRGGAAVPADEIDDTLARGDREEALVDPEEEPLDVRRGELGLAGRDPAKRQAVPPGLVAEEDAVTAVSELERRHGHPPAESNVAPA